MLKQKAYRNKKYLDWVKTQPCVLCQNEGGDAHHIIGTGSLSGMGMKAPDNYVMPVCREHHQYIHATPEIWETQWMWALRTLCKAMAEGVV